MGVKEFYDTMKDEGIYGLEILTVLRLGQQLARTVYADLERVAPGIFESFCLEAGRQMAVDNLEILRDAMLFRKILEEADKRLAEEGFDFGEDVDD